ncbi:putative S-adenosyl-L-methionine-dependent methyltransferase MidA [Phytophthora cinnamomi]|nr:putative S-adenosyl-L-methionine-dependent methyltransferase MidA [Phytophthora cinnamomi]
MRLAVAGAARSRPATRLLPTARGLASSAAAAEAEEGGVLTRELIYASLYAKEAGYFTTQQREVLHAPTQGIDFGNLWGAGEYRNVVAQLYRESPEAWLTPVEVFAPHYSQALARYMLSSPFLRQEQLLVFEIGGGSGSNALHILDYLQQHAPDVYAKTKYTLVEISPVMAERQRRRVAAAHPQHCTVLNQDILTFADTHAPVNAQCFFLALEVLDNLPHDKVALQNGKWFETVVQMQQRESDGDAEPLLREATRPMNDMLIRQTLRYFGCELPLRVSYKNNSGLAQRVRRMLGKVDPVLHSAFIPTGAMQLLNTLRTAFPKHHLIAADFDSLPAPNLDDKSPIKAIEHPLSPTATSSGTLFAGNAPLVASKVTGVTKDHDTYLVQGGIADIFFATDFERLKKAYCSALQRQPEEVSVVKSSEFLKEFADVQKTKTITRYNPLLEDYSNTSFILS